MTVTISFRVSEELEEFLEQEAERRMTTKSTVAQMLLAEKVREVRGGSEGDTAEKDGQEGVSTSKLGESTTVEFESKDAADQFRQDHSEYVDREQDDMRLKTVAVTENTPSELIPDN